MILAMSRKPTKGYFVKGHFVALGSELDLELKRELKGDVELSRTDLKKHSDHLQQLGEQLLTLRKGLLDKLDLPDNLREALVEAKRITNFEGKRRQMQYIGKLMRKLDETVVSAVEAALDVQHQGSAQETLRLHVAEQWRDRNRSGRQDRPDQQHHEHRYGELADRLPVEAGSGRCDRAERNRHGDQPACQRHVRADR